MTDDPQDLPVLDALGRAVPQVAPPAELRARVLAAATAAAQEDAPAVVARPTPTPAPARVAEPDRPGSSSSRWPWLLAAAAALIAVFSSLGWVGARREVERLHTTIAELRTNATALLAVRADFDRAQSASQRVLAILSAEDVHYTALGGQPPTPGARGRVYMSPTRGLLMAADALPALPAGRTYQLWTIVAGQPVSHGVFDPEANGRAQVIADAPPGAAQAFAVTVEPAGGVPAPTGPKVLLGVPAL
ncbi:MAG: anti-sigma factor [Acidobacteriota bacterium]